VAGALAERAFAEKLQRAGFEEVVIGERQPFGIDDVASYPLFTPELIAVMRRTIPAARQACVATAVIARARKPGS
jgi:arsenite methyltransferase